MRKKLFLSIVLILSLGVAVRSQAQTPHGLGYTWDQSVTPGIISNRLECGVASKNYTFSWVFSNPTTSFNWLTTDTQNPPTQGKQYFCAVTASNGIESDPSNEVVATFPVVPVPSKNLQVKTF